MNIFLDRNLHEYELINHVFPSKSLQEGPESRSDTEKHSGAAIGVPLCSKTVYDGGCLPTHMFESGQDTHADTVTICSTHKHPVAIVLLIFTQILYKVYIHPSQWTVNQMLRSGLMASLGERATTHNDLHIKQPINNAFRDKTCLFQFPTQWLGEDVTRQFFKCHKNNINQHLVICTKGLQNIYYPSLPFLILVSKLLTRATGLADRRLAHIIHIKICLAHLLSAS